MTDHKQGHILLQAAQAQKKRIIALRRAVHAEPELGLETPLTLAKVKADLTDLDLEWREGPSCTGAVAILKGGKPGPSVLLRGDMDALPMQEETGLDFSSKIEGRMHACGHDTHTAMLAGAAHILAGQQADLAGEVRFMFQPGEEGFHGARFMLDDGLLHPLPDAAFALHIMPNSPHGVIAGRDGAMLAAADMLEITVTGKGGHASMPHDTSDPIPVAAEIIIGLQSMVTRKFDAAEACVVTITQMDAGSAHNIIANDAHLRGTIRTLSPERRAQVREAITRTANHIAKAHDCSAEIRFIDGFPVTINDPRAVSLGENLAKEMPIDSQQSSPCWHRLPHPLMGAEDFSYVLEKVPGAMFFLGVAKQGEDWKNCCGIHSSGMMVDEDALPKGAAFLAGCALRFLASRWK